MVMRKENGVMKKAPKEESGRIITSQEVKDGELKNMTDKRCQICGKLLDFSDITHCSEECLFESIKNSKRFMP